MKPEKPNGYVFEYQVVYYRSKPNVKFYLLTYFHTKLYYICTIQIKVSTEISVIDGPHTVTLENETNTFVVISGLQSGLTYKFLVHVFCIQTFVDS